MTFRVGDEVRWASHGGEAHGVVVRVAHEDGEIAGFRYRATRDDPRYIVKLEDGRHAAHTAHAISKV
jgi:hypothetical protein